MPTAPEPILPANFDRYLPKSIIAQTNSAIVYFALDPKMDNREVVIKVLSRSNLNDEVSRARFIQEAALLTKMEHPAIVPLYDKGFDGNQPYLVMRYMRGGTLSGKMSHGRLSPKFTCEVVEQISKALDFAHKHDVVHRDIKPLNILFDQDSNAYLSDFGIATLLNAQGQLTGQGAIGTPVFMSPEQAEGKALTGASDIYSLGIAVFFCLTGQLPYVYSRDTPTIAILNKHISETPRRLREVDASLSVDMEDVIAKALEKSPEKRYSSASGFSEALTAAWAGEQVSDGSDQSTDPGFPVRDSTRNPGKSIWVCSYCGYSFNGQRRSCPICGHADLRQSA